MKKIGIICFALVLALGSLGVGYAMWSEELVIDTTVETGEVEVCIQEDKPITMTDVGVDHHASSTCDPAVISYIGPDPKEKNVGITTATRLDCDTLEVIVTDGYPCYYNHIDFWMKNMGTVPVRVWKIVIAGGLQSFTFYDFPSAVCLDLGGDANNDLILEWGNSWGAQLEPGENVNFSFDFHILQEAPQGAGIVGPPMSFTITVHAVQWNEYIQGPIIP